VSREGWEKVSREGWEKLSREGAGSLDRRLRRPRRSTERSFSVIMSLMGECPTFAFPLPAAGPAGAAEPSVPPSSARAGALYTRRISAVMLSTSHDFTFAAARRLPRRS
jgi:hypothetical protein